MPLFTRNFTQTDRLSPADTPGFEKEVIAVNAARIKAFCLGFVFLGSVLFIVDSVVPVSMELQRVYRWSDAVLIAIGALFFTLATLAGRQDRQQVINRIIHLAAAVSLAWCGGVAAVEYFTHHSVSTLIIGSLVLATGLYLKARYLALIYGVGIGMFFLVKWILAGPPLQVLSQHINLLGLTVFCLVISRMIYLHKLENVIHQKEILEKNRALSREIAIRRQAQDELKAIRKDLENKVVERTSELMRVNADLKNEIRERKKMAATLQQAQKMESIGTLAGGIAHDFNNILFPILGMSELLLEDLPRNSQSAENVREILKAGKRGKDLVMQILAFSRQSEHRLIPVRAQKIVREALKLMRATIPAYIRIREDIDEDCGLVKADPSQIHQVVMNLTTNAFHAVEPEGGEISVSLKAASPGLDSLAGTGLSPGRYAVLSVADTGHGMSPDLMTKIFEPYVTTKKSGKGTGLGLAVVYGIVKEHRGDITVRSREGKGATFTVYLPLTDPGTPLPEPAPGKPRLPRGSERILLVDDEAPIARIQKQMLERLGYTVTSRTCSTEALEAFAAAPDRFDLVITDMNMPNMTGDQLASAVMAIRPDIPVIVCTGFSEKMDRGQADAIGIKVVLMKPAGVTDLGRAVRRALDGSASP